MNKYLFLSILEISIFHFSFILFIICRVVAIGNVEHYRGRTAAAFVAPLAFVMWGITLLVLTILFKWLLIGRYKAGTYPLWGWYYLRWWVVHRMIRASEAVLQVIVGTPLYTNYLRLMGASIGYNSKIHTAFVTEFDLISIGKDSTIGEVRKNYFKLTILLFLHALWFDFLFLFFSNRM
jgi:non-ribosomal peptide synthetase-like protein